MAVRERTGRKRYIAFEVLKEDRPLTRGILSRAIEGKIGGDVDVILIEGGRGIVRTGHRLAKTLIDVLNSFEYERDGFELRTLKTSGTIRKLKSRYFGS